MILNLYMSKTLCYTGLNALPSSQHTIPEFMDIMNTNEKHYCTRDKARKKCIDCTKLKKKNSKHILEMSAAGHKIIYPVEGYNVLYDKCEQCIQKHMNSMPSCNLKEYMNYSGAIRAIRGKCPPNTMAPGDIKPSSTLKSKGIWNKLKSFIGAGRFKTRRYKHKRCKCKSKKCKHKHNTLKSTKISCS